MPVCRGTRAPEARVPPLPATACCAPHLGLRRWLPLQRSGGARRELTSRPVPCCLLLYPARRELTSRPPRGPALAQRSHTGLVGVGVGVGVDAALTRDGTGRRNLGRALALAAGGVERRRNLGLALALAAGRRRRARCRARRRRRRDAAGGGGGSGRRGSGRGSAFAPLGRVGFVGRRHKRHDVVGLVAPQIGVGLVGMEPE